MPGAVVLPSTVQAIYAGQLDDLPPPIRDVARRASVAGRRLPAEALQALGVVAPDAGVEGLLARALVSGPIADVVTGPGFAYRHALLHDAAAAASAVPTGSADVQLARWLSRSQEMSATPSPTASAVTMRPQWRLLPHSPRRSDGD